jgi:hypothetical protein
MTAPFLLSDQKRGPAKRNRKVGVADDWPLAVLTGCRVRLRRGFLPSHPPFVRLVTRIVFAFPGAVA